jgi:hypothetical protein
MRGKKFDRKMTLNRMGVPSAIVDESVLKHTPIYSWIRNRPFEHQALHNIRLTFQSDGIWNTFSKMYPDTIDPTNQDIRLPTLTFFNYIDAIVTVHHSDTVSVAISCSQRPIAIQTEDFIQLYEMLTRIEEHLSKIIYQQQHNTNESFPNVSIPNFRKWVVKLWHFGVDSIHEYNGKEFQVTFEEGIADLIRIYTKRMAGNNKQKLRVEKQENPNQAIADAFVQRYFRDGRLVVPGDEAAD